MTQEEKQILIADLCARLPYDLMIEIIFSEMDCDTGKVKFKKEKKLLGMDDLDWLFHDAAEIKPYLRPMSSMTEEEKDELIGWGDYELISWLDDEEVCFGDLTVKYETLVKLMDWLNANHLDYRGLIGKDLALEAPKDMYDIK